MSGSFRSTVWDPVLILAQIVCMQSVFYLGLGALVAVSDYILGLSRGLDHLFSYQELAYKETHGKFILASYMVNALIGAVGLWYVVRRTRQCLDFSCTVHLFHLLACWVFNLAFPTSLVWWLTCIASIAFMTVLGEYLCMRTEMQAIPLGAPRADL